jgi:hypothetical protein
MGDFATTILGLILGWHSQSYDAERFAYRHSRRNAMPMPKRTNDQTQEVLTWITPTPENRNTTPAIRKSGPVTTQ